MLALDDFSEHDYFYRFLGIYVVIFQSIESQLEQIISLAKEHEAWTETQSLISRKNNSEKILLVTEIATKICSRSDDPNKENWLTDFHILIERIRAEAVRRNKLMHSKYLFDFFPIGLGPIRSNLLKQGKEFKIEVQDLSKSSTDQIVEELALLAWDVAQAKIQLVHWHE